MTTQSRNLRARRADEFIEAHAREYPVQTMCRILDVAPNGYYEWLHKPVSDRALEDARLHQTDLDRMKDAFGRILGAEWTRAFKLGTQYVPRPESDRYRYSGDRSVFEVNSPGDEDDD